MILGMSKTFFTFLFLVLSIQFAHAIAIPPAAIDEQQVQPSCITVRPAYIFGQKQVYGTDGKGPAVRIENTCAEKLTIETVQTGAAGQLKLVARIDVLVAADKSRVNAPYDFIFVPAGGDCKGIREAQQRESDKQLDARWAHKARLQKAENAEEMLEELRKHEPPRADLRIVTCDEIDIEPGGFVTLAMPWETAYLITGKPGVTIAGQMINPLDVTSPETFQFAQNGDKATRHMLALHNISTGQNLKLAMRWLNEAAKEGYRPALYQLANCYETGGCGVEKSGEEVLFWLSLAEDVEKRAEMEKQIPYARRQFINQRLEDWKKTHPSVTDY